MVSLHPFSLLRLEEAAESIGIGTQTMLRWLKIPEFQTARLEARRAAVGQSSARLQQRLTTWFDATEQYPRQLHEVDRADYLQMKNNEYRRQQTAQ